jgi:hypothetical protein
VELLLPPRNGAGAASRSRGCGRPGTKQEPPWNETGGRLLSTVRTGGGGQRLLNETGGRLLLRAAGASRGRARAAAAPLSSGWAGERPVPVGAERWPTR